MMMYFVFNKVIAMKSMLHNIYAALEVHCQSGVLVWLCDGTLYHIIVFIWYGMKAMKGKCVVGVCKLVFISFMRKVWICMQ